jgi:uncharacterized protein YycO
MTSHPQIRTPRGLPPPVDVCSANEPELHLVADLQTLREIINGLDRLEARLDSSEIPKTAPDRGYFTPDEDDRVRQGVLVYRNYRLAAYDIILRYRTYGVLPGPCGLRCFLVAFAAGLVLYAKSLKVISFAEHVPMLRAKINEPDSKFEIEPGFFEDVLAGYSRIRNYRALLQADKFWRKHRREAHELASNAGDDWKWLVGLIRHQRGIVQRRLLHVLWQRFRYDWGAFRRTGLSPFRHARQGLEKLLSDHLAGAELTDRPSDWAMTDELIAGLASFLQPGDILLTRNDHRLTAALVPGFWAHAALYLGTRSQLESLGLRQHPYVLKHWDDIPEDSAGTGLVIEALAPRVQLNPLEKCLRVDHLAVVRSTLPHDEISAAIAEALGHLGKPYDFEFDFNNSSRVVCTELIYRSYHHRGPVYFSLTKRLGRFTLTGDDFIAHVLDGMGESGPTKVKCFFPIALLLTRRDGRPHVAQPERMLPLLQRIRRGWRPARKLRGGGAPKMLL